MKLSKRTETLEPSVTLAASTKAKELKSQGVDVLSVTLGEPDFPTPKNIQKAAIAAIESGKASFYTPSAGIPELRQAIVDYIEKFYGLTYDVSQTLVTDGAKFALYALFQAILDEGDEVIIPTPYWVSYGEQVKLADGTPVFVEGSEDNQFKVTVAQLESVRTEQSKAVILNSPSNPTGMIYTKDELQAIGEWAVAHDLLIIADDIYGRLVYDGNEFTPIATISEEIRKQTLIINGVSKSYSMTGWRIGFAIGDKELIQAMTDIASQSTSNPTAVSQYAAVEALTGTQDTVEEMRQAFEERLNRLYPLMLEIPGVKLAKPQGAFYLFPNVKGTMELCGYTDVTEFTDALLNEAHVAVVTGAGFGANENIRLSYASDWATLEETVNRIKAFVEKNRRK
ncbi:pyridoxal phosphate-dependent aminotransferase [Enterococcus saccharolyticus]|uniref:Aminotransferase n=1 Tax=Enterococcus saccharolyticus subsp. saccharolyticus ATCC 43076 TaxID=1139996 RepID=S0NS89_9ENTE|nr:pyridoxal phosphate-dependent aminotransferase [Enterococcus saccharolyticus]EOT30230.1 aspartate aminotransferase [Enterococcus saccharolyticus subsp. saccharolyticus ATCC 43076]EOT80775.1 aspartate aminotransferase [Enterococcus saccharolyticus subsp. saccharolyticus ATCC 43076]